MADAFGRPLRFRLTGSQVYNGDTAEVVLDGVKGDAVIADGHAIRNAVRAVWMKAGILASCSRHRRIRHDWPLHHDRNGMGRCFDKPKHFRRLATCDDRRARHFFAFLPPSSMIWMR
ncbi:hypothetical protein [Bradyrhizobium sp. SZCCHNS1054]|uniref:hypothetical protein n=1 Tax=Bradyrhizobium sp. SZCCHNS1054 TaxID=3057301 RepID=UPI00291694FF|nr:hypothetical protein [Bradyrhizobium sp. SZCCHNS1054]